MYKGNFFLIPIILICIGFHKTFGQDEYSGVAPEKNKEILFDKIIGLENSGIVNGREYMIPFRGLKSHPFFDRQDASATVEYDGNKYHEMQILYDIYSDILVFKVLTRAGSFAFIELDKSRVGSFDAYNHHFKKYNLVDLKFNVDGYFDVLFERESMSLVVKRSKISRVIDRVAEYEEFDQYFLIDHGRWIKFRKMKSFYTLLKSKESKRRLDNFMSSNGIKGRNATDEDLKKIALFYYEIIQGK
jgi:hypothetical protein